MSEAPKSSLSQKELIAESQRLQEKALEMLKKAAEIDRQIEANKRALQKPPEKPPDKSD